MGGRWFRRFYSYAATALLALFIAAMSLFPLFAETASAAITLNWTAPTTNTDGSALSLADIKGYRIYYGVYYGPDYPCTFTDWLDVDGGSVTSYALSLAGGTTYCFAVAAENTALFWSAYSNVVYKTEAGASDTTAPVISSFNISLSSSPYTAYINSLSATDNVGVTGYLINESATTPSAAAAGWDANVPTSYIFTTTGSKTLYAWAKDAAGNVSASRSAAVTIGSSGTNSIALTPVSDTYIDIDDTNYSGSATLNTYTWPNARVANTILMKFDVSGIPAGAAIQSATLNLYLLDSDTIASYPTYNLSLNRIINRNPDLSRATGYTADGSTSWTPNTYCYNNIPLAQADITAAYDTGAIDKTLGFKSLNATQLIAGWVASPSTNRGLMINSDATKAADTYRAFASSKHSNSAYHPYLAVTYTGGSAACSSNPKYKVGAGSMYNYSSIQNAYAGLYSGDVLQIQADDFSGNLTLDQNKSIYLDGGYICDFSSNTGYTAISGTLTISSGSVTVSNLIIK